jgi:hypothetical protein
MGFQCVLPSLPLVRGIHMSYFFSLFFFFYLIFSSLLLDNEGPQRPDQAGDAAQAGRAGIVLAGAGIA